MGSISQHIEAIVPYAQEPILPEFGAGTIEQYRMPFEYVTTQIHDIRAEPDCSLDVQGFQAISVPPLLNGAQHDYNDPDYIKSTYYAEVAELMRNVSGGSRVHCYSHLVRTQAPSAVHAMRDDNRVPDTQLTGVAVPSPGAHTDHSTLGSWEVLRDNLSEAEAEEVVKEGKRWAIINLWRPIKTVHRDPLCLCDARTVDLTRDSVEVRANLPKSTTSTFRGVSKGGSFGTVVFKSNPRHKWYYCSELTPDEALVLKIHDTAAGQPNSKGGGVIAGGIPHTALTIPGTEGLEPRQSIEVRCLVFWD